MGSTLTFQHESLNATLEGVQTQLDGVSVNSFRGIKFGYISSRFALPQPLHNWEGKTLDCRNYGPRCPQISFDVGHLLRVPEDEEVEKEDEDEFECLNLHISLPDQSAPKGGYPVLIWIHGGSQVVTFASAAAKCCDPTRLIADSVNHQEPIIIVSLNYRLNIFAFGDGKGETNLALKDQRLGIDWVVKHISGFGGDKNNITLAGESAGGVYVHAHSILNAPVRRAILSSGSLWLSPPLPLVRGQSLVDNLSKRVEESEKASLRDAPATSLVHHLNEMGIKSMWLQAEPGLADWDKKAENIEELIIGDVEYETVIWRNGIESMTSSQIVSAFSLAPRSAELQRLYGISSSRSTSSKIGALDFIHDLKFTWPVETIATRWRTKGKPVYQYIVDQTNPWQSSNRAHHTVDLILLFGGYDLSFNPAAEAVGQEMRARWINFVNGQPPWSAERRMAFGPFGESKEIGEREFAARRRVRHMELLKEIGLEELNPVFAALAAGRISLEN